MSIENGNHQVGPVDQPLSAGHAGHAIFENTLPQTSVLRAMLGTVLEIELDATRNRSDMALHNGRLDNAREIVRMHEVAISKLEESADRLSDEGITARERILSATDSAGDDLQLQDQLEMLTRDPLAINTGLITKTVGTYIASKLFRRGDAKKAMIAQEWGAEAHNDPELVAASALITFMFSDTHESKKGLGQPFIQMKINPEGALETNDAGHVERFSMIGGSDALNDILLERGVEKVSEDQPLDKWLLIASDTEKYRGDAHVVAINDMAYEPEDTFEHLRELLQKTIDPEAAKKDHAAVRMLGANSINTTISALHHFTTQEDMQESERARLMDILEDLLLTMYDSGISLEQESSDSLQIPEAHLANSLVRHSEEAIEHMKQRILSNASLMVSTKLVDFDSDEKTIVELHRVDRKTKRIAKLFSTPLSQPTNIEEITADSLNEVMGPHYSDVYLTEHNSHRYNAIPYIARIAANNALREAPNNDEIKRVCEYIAAECDAYQKKYAAEQSVPQDETADNQQSAQDQEVEPEK